MKQQNILKAMCFSLFSIFFLSIFLGCSDNGMEPIKLDPNKQFVVTAKNAHGNLFVYLSKDGKVWKKHKTDLPDGFRFRTMLYAQGKIWGLKDMGTRKDLTHLYTTEDMVHWTPVEVDFKLDDGRKLINNLYYDQGKFVLVGTGETVFEGAMYYSSDGYTWSERIIQEEVGGINSLFKFKNKYYAIGGGKGIGESIKQKVMVSSDLENWVMQKAVINGSFNEAVTNNKTVVASRFSFAIGGDAAKANTPEVYYTEDTSSWTSPKGLECYMNKNGYFDIFQQISYERGRFIGVGRAGKVGYSKNGTDWEELTLSEYDFYGAVASKAGYVVTLFNVKGNSYITNEAIDIVFYSEDAKNWTPVVNETAMGGQRSFYLPIIKEAKEN